MSDTAPKVTRADIEAAAERLKNWGDGERTITSAR
jgi:hypothetical protein